METIKITIKEYNQLLKIAYCSDSYLDTNNELTKNRLTEYINDFNQLNK
jgi:hypothetical protein